MEGPSARPLLGGLRALLPRNKRTRHAIYALGGVLLCLQLLFLGVWLLAPSGNDDSLPTGTGGGAGTRRDVADAADFWSKYFPHDNAVQWNDFAVYLLMEYARDIRNLTASLTPALGGHFDFDNDGTVSRKEYNRCEPSLHQESNLRCGLLGGGGITARRQSPRYATAVL
jgi:hypothetical protein